jgi:hypothetical protein
MPQALQLKDPFQEAPCQFSTQGLAILTGVFLGLCQSPSCQYHELILKPAALI